MCTRSCVFGTDEDGDIPVREFPLKLKMFRTLGLEEFLINRFVKSYSKVSYTFPRKNLKFLETQTCHIPLVYFPQPLPQSSVVMVYSHGSGSNLEHVYQVGYRLWKLYNVAVVVYDYSGCGQSRKSHGVMEEDLMVVLSWVLKLGYNISNVILCGFSLGSYPTLCIPGEIPRIVVGGICGLIPFVEGEVVQFKKDPFDNIKNCRKLHNTRVLIIHSKNDKKVPIEHSRLLYTALTSKRSKIEVDKITHIQTNGLEHNQTMNFVSRLIQRNKQMMNFIETAKEPRQLDVETLQLNRKLCSLEHRVQQEQQTEA